MTARLLVEPKSGTVTYRNFEDGSMFRGSLGVMSVSRGMRGVCYIVDEPDCL